MRGYGRVVSVFGRFFRDVVGTDGTDLGSVDLIRDGAPAVLHGNGSAIA